MLKHIYI